MGIAGSREEDELNLAVNLKPPGTPPMAISADNVGRSDSKYDQMADNDFINIGDHEEGTTNVYRSKFRSSWWILLFLFIIFVVLAVSAGVRCGVDPECRIHEIITDSNSTLVVGIPSLGRLLDHTATDTLTVTGVNVLMGMHFLLTINTGLLVKDHTWLAPLGLFISSSGVYVMTYVSLLVPHWYIAIIPILCMIVWCAFVVYGLGLFYRPFPKKKIYYATVIAFILFAIPAALYAAFSAVEYYQVPGKDVAVFVCELAILISFLFFILLLVYHTRRVSYGTQIERGYTII